MESLLSTIEGCLKNNPRDQKHLYEGFYGYGLKVVFRYIYHYDKAVDVVNDGFVKLFRNLVNFRTPDVSSAQPMFMRWMKTIMINTAIDYLRRNNYSPEIGSLTDEVWAQPDAASTDQTLLFKELIQQVRALPPGYRAVFNMFVIDGYTHHEISEMMGISVGTSKSNLSKARAHLQKTIKKNDGDLAVCTI